jgi:hypothetical protein
MYEVIMQGIYGYQILLQTIISIILMSFELREELMKADNGNKITIGMYEISINEKYGYLEKEVGI